MNKKIVTGCQDYLIVGFSSLFFKCLFLMCFAYIIRHLPALSVSHLHFSSTPSKILIFS